MHSILFKLRSRDVYEKLKSQAQRVGDRLDKAVSFITCCAPTHKGNFNSDLEIMRKAIAVLVELTPASPIEEITQPAVALGKACRQMCAPYLSSTDASTSSTASTTIPSTNTVSTLVRELSAAVEANLALIKNRTSMPQDQTHIQLIRSAVEKSKETSLAIVEIVKQSEHNKPVDVHRLDPLYDELTQSCRDVVTAAQKLFSDV